MFRVRREIMDAFARAARADFEEQIQEDVEEAFPEEVAALNKAELQVRIHRTVDRAMGYGIDDQEDVATFVDLTFEHGENFESDADKSWALRILRDPSRDGTEKVEAIQELLDAPGQADAS